MAIHFSPGGKYLIVYQKANASGAGDDKNMTVWDVSGGTKVGVACKSLKYPSIGPWLVDRCLWFHKIVRMYS